MAVGIYATSFFGEVAEWANALDLKSSDVKASVGSNPTLSVNQWLV